MMIVICAVLCGVVSGLLVYGVATLGDESLEVHNAKE